MRQRNLVIRMDYLTRRRAIALLGEIAESLPHGTRKLTALSTLRALRDARDGGLEEGEELQEPPGPRTRAAK